MTATREWRVLRAAMAVLAVLIAADLVAWEVRELTIYRPTRLELSLRCLRNEKGVLVVTPAGSPIADSARAGSLRTRIEGNGVTVALAATAAEARKLQRDYRSVAGGLAGRLERRGLVVYLWEGVASPTQRQTMYDCAY